MKATVQGACSVVPGGATLHRFLQERITHSLPAGPTQIAEMVDAARQHLAAVERVTGSTERQSIRGFEFGVGWHLGVAIATAMLGVGRQTVVDRFRLADDALLRHSIDNIAPLIELDDRAASASRASTSRRCSPPARRDIPRPDRCAPQPGLTTEAFDFASSTSTLEHVPTGEIPSLLAECRRLLRPGGVITLLIDYKDHYGAFDPSCSVYNFLRFSDRRWRKYSPSFHYQNRLRHSDYLRLVELAGFEIC